MTITTVGEILVDLTQVSTDVNGIPNFAANPGGAPANVAVAAARLGADTNFIGCVGDDYFGDLLRKTLVKNSVGIDGLQITNSGSTTLAIVSIDCRGERSFSFCRKPGADTCIDEKNAIESLGDPGILHFGSVSLSSPNCRDVIEHIVKHAKSEGFIITYDPNYRESLWSDYEEAIAQMRRPLPLCDVIKISDEETELLAGVRDPKDAAAVLLSKGIKLVIITLGEDGAYWRYGNTDGTVPGFKVKVADTNGAGDTFFGAFLSKIAQKGVIDGLSEKEIEEYVRFANKAASITTSKPGAIPAMPNLNELNFGG